MDEDDLDDLNSEQRAELEGHLYSLIHHRSSEISKPVGCESVSLSENPFNCVTGPLNENRLYAENKTEIDDNKSSKDAILPKPSSRTVHEESDSDVICLSDSDDNDDDVIVIKQPTPELICIESDEYDSDDSAAHSNNAPDVQKMLQKQNSSPTEEIPKTTFVVPKPQTIQNSLHNGNSSFVEKFNNRSCSSPTSVASDDFIRNDCDNLNISDQNEFQFNIHHPELNVSTSTQVSAYVAASDTSSDCTEVSTNHEILVHSEDMYLSNTRVGPRNSDIQPRMNKSTENIGFSSKNTSIDQDNSKHKNTRTKKSHDKSKSNLRDSTFNSDNNLHDGSQMEDFYSKSWGGETFDHNSIISNMSRDRNQWKISNSDRRRCSKSPGWKPIRCHNCNHMGHPAMNCTEPKHITKCYMCGMDGHAEPRCPNKICLKCGKTTNSFVVGCNMCRSSISNICQLCGMPGHHKKNCPDLWRRYHKTTDTSNTPVVDHQPSLKSPQNSYCSNCSLRGHLYHNCLELRPNQHGLIWPSIVDYTAVYPVEPKRTYSAVVANDKNPQEKPKVNKRKSDGVLSTPKQCKYNENDFLNSLNDIESLASDDSFDISRSTMTDFIEDTSGNFECLDQSHLDKSFPRNIPENGSSVNQVNQAPKPITQDNSVTSSDSEIVSNTLMTDKETFGMLMKNEGAEFLKEASQLPNFTVQLKFASDGGSLLLTGSKAQQQFFQQKLKDWSRKINKQLVSAGSLSCLPRKAGDLLNYLKLQMNSISKSLGSPLIIYSNLKSVEISAPAIMNTRQIKLYNRQMRKLNMCLLGRYGYGDGKLHMEKLKEKIIEVEKLPKPESIVPAPLYKEIKTHYDYVFTSFDHGNYEELLNKFKADRFSELALKMQSNELCQSNNVVQQGDRDDIPFPRNNGDEFLMEPGQIPQMMHPQTSTPNRMPRQQFQEFVKAQMIQHYNECLRYAASIIDQARCSKTLKKQLRAKLRPFLSRYKTGKVLRRHVIALEAVVKSLKKVKFVTSNKDNV